MPSAPKRSAWPGAGGHVIAPIGRRFSHASRVLARSYFFVVKKWGPEKYPSATFISSKKTFRSDYALDRRSVDSGQGAGS